MKCPSPDKIAAYLLEELAATENQAVMLHVEECANCEQVMATLAEDLALGDTPASSKADTPPGAVAANLLFGLLALHNSFITRGQLISATSEWLEDKSQQLETILVQQSAISDEEKQLVEALVARHLASHQDSLELSLANVSSLADVEADLKNFNDPDVEASLSLVPTVGSALQPTKPTRESRTLPLERERYKELHSHAKGGLGEVFLALDQQLDRNVALKRIQPRLADDQTCRLRFEQEAEVTGKLEHPGIVPVYGRGADKTGRPFYAMRFIRGRNLKRDIGEFHQAFGKQSWRTGEARLKLHELVNRIIDVCNTIEYAHHRGFLHRDLKPDNIMLGRFGETIVVDWGLAKKKDGTVPDAAMLPHSEDDVIRSRNNSDSTPTPTTFGTVVGTLGYMSPEQAAGDIDEMGTGSDIYGLGAILYRTLADQASQDLKLPQKEILERIKQGNITPPSQIKSQVPPALEAICLKAMSRHPVDRYQSAQAMAVELNRWIAEERVDAHRENIFEKTFRLARRYRGTVATGLATFAALAALTVATFAIRDADRSKEQKRAVLEQAQRTIDSWLTESAEDLRDYPGVQAFRKHLLESAVAEYEQFVAAGSNDPLYELERAKTLLRLGDIQFEIGDADAGEGNFNRAKTILETLTAEQTPNAQYQLANAIERIGQVESSTVDGKPDKHFREAVGIYEKLLQADPQSAEIQNALGATLVQRAALLLGRSEHNQAETITQQAIDAYTKAIELESSERSHIRGLSTARSLLGEALRRSGKLDDAEQLFREAVEESDRLFAEQPKNRDYLELRADARSYLAQMHRYNGRIAEELSVTRRMRNDYAQLLKDFPSVVRYQESSARATMDEGQILNLQNQPQKAYDLLLEASENFADLDQKQLKPRYIEALAVSRDNLAQSCWKLNRIEDGLVFGENAVAGFVHLVDTIGGDRYRHRLALAHGHLGQLLQNQGKQQAAQTAYFNAATLLDRLVKTSAPNEAIAYKADLAWVYEEFGSLLFETDQVAPDQNLLNESKNLWTDIEDQAPQFKNSLARFLVTSIDTSLRDSQRALQLAEAATNAAPNNPDFAATLAAAHYRSKNFAQTIEQVAKAKTLREGEPQDSDSAFDLYFLAMAQFEQEQIDEAKTSLASANTIFQQRTPGDYTLARLQTEAQNLINGQADDAAPADPN